MVKATKYHPHSRILRWLLALWRDKLTSAGRVVFIGLVVSVLGTRSEIAVPVFHLGCVLIAQFCIAFGAGFLLRPRLRIAMHFPEKATVGQTICGHCTLTNRSWLSAMHLSAGFFKLPPALNETVAESLIPCIASGESADAPLEIQALKRGFYTMPRLRPFTTFPFNLLRTATRSDSLPGKLLVLPAFRPAGGIDVPGNARYQPGGIALTSNVGESPEYIGNRDYRAGDPMKRIDFRSWGRLARPVVREYQEEYYCRIALVFDTFVPANRKEAPEGFDDFEAAVSLSASVADALAKSEYILDIFAAGPELYIFRSGRHLADFDNVLEILACVDACRANPFDTVTPALVDELSNISTVICVLLDWDTAREQLARAAADVGCSAKILIVRDGPTTMPLDGAEQWADVSVFTPEDIRQGRYDVL